MYRYMDMDIILDEYWTSITIVVIIKKSFFLNIMVQNWLHLEGVAGVVYLDSFWMLCTLDVIIYIESFC